MNKRLYIISFLLSLIINQSVNAQDARFSQYFNTPLTINPALAGNGIEYIRITAIYRTQWAGFGTPFTTQGLSVDKVVNRVGIGATITRNGAGDASIKTLNALGNLSYHLPLGKNKNHTLSAGVQVGIVNKSFDPNKLTFDNQYNPDQGYDPNQGSGEVFENTSITRPDVNAGFMWQRGWTNKDIRFKPFAGISFSHLTKPKETFVLDGIDLPIKQTVYAGAGFMITDRTEITPSAMYLTQGTFSETTFGSLLSYKLDNKNAVQIGLFNRVDDSFITYAGYQMNLLYVGMSYDINTGELSKTGKGTNAFEITLTYSPRPKKKKEPKFNLERTEEELMETIPSHQIPVELTQELALIDIIPVESSSSGESQPVDNVITESTDPVSQPEVKTDIRVDNEPAVVRTEEIPSTTTVTETIEAVTVPAIETEIAITSESAVNKKQIDSDGDGIMDADDNCPYMKGTAATMGCPDSDNDGIIDSEDDCPMAGGPATNKGCPDPNISNALASQELVKTYDHILFETGSTRLTTGDIYDIIERAVDVLYADPTTSVMLSGHTDSEGGGAFNMTLSQSRANVVKAYLEKQGIDPSRIETVAYGETMPLRNNDLKENRKQNRRVELNIIRKN